MKGLETDLFQKFRDCDIEDTESLRLIKAELSLLSNLESKLNGMIQRGVIAQSRKDNQ